MYAPPGVKTAKDMPVPDMMRAWVLGNPGELKLTEKPVPVPKRAEVLVRIDAVAICATDLEIIWHGPPASIQGGLPFNKNWTPGPRIHGHGRGARPRCRRVQDRPARDGRDSRRLRPVQALPRGHVHLVPQLRPQLRRRRQGPPRQRLHHRRRLLRIPGQQHQHAGRDRRRDVGRGGDPGRHRRHRHVRPHRARRPGGGRERGGDRTRPDWLARRRGRQGARRPPRDPHRHARQPPEDRQELGADHVVNVRNEDRGRRDPRSTAARASTTWWSAPARPMR